ncbi:MAG: NAD(+)/NADH kinase [Patescibacteria group bacterium]
MSAIGLLPHRAKPEAMAATAALAGKLAGAGVAVRLDAGTAAAIGRPELGYDGDFADGLDLAIALGGDGALLHAARCVYPRQIPVFGINFGHLGFLAEVEAARLDEAVSRILSGDYRCEDRLMVEALPDKPGAGAVVGLNDAVITRIGQGLVTLEVVLNGVALVEYRADALIVATPTGSTAYSLSAGGPILHPGVPALVITPVCAHSLHARPLVVSADDSIAVRVVHARDEVSLVADSRDGGRLRPGDTVRFGRAAAVTRLVRLRGLGFYDILRQRFQEGKM